MRTRSDLGQGDLLLSADERAALMPAQQHLLAALARFFTPEELALLTAEDIEFFLRLEHDTLPDISPQAAFQAARTYRDRLRLKRTAPPR